jgi:hypothetical protein
MVRRFSSGRNNDWGKDPETKRLTIEYAARLFKEPAPRLFTKLDTTELDVSGVCKALLSMVSKVPSEKSLLLPKAEKNGVGGLTLSKEKPGLLKQENGGS